MQALICKNWGTPKDLVWEETPEPKLKPYKVLIQIEATGLNFPDLLLMAGQYQAKPDFPFIPGGEVAGKIIAVGEKVKNFEVGQRVAAYCGIGGLADVVAVAANKVVAIPDSMTAEEGAALIVAYGTAHLGLIHRVNLQKDEKILIHGAAGGVALAAVDIAQYLGAEIYATASTEEKLNLAKEYGAKHLINYKDENFSKIIKKQTSDRGIDVIFDPVGGEVLEKSLRVLAWEGRLLVIGFTSGKIAQAPSNLLLLKNASLVGLFWNKYPKMNPELFENSLKELVSWFEQGFIKPRVHQVFDKKDIIQAYNLFHTRKVMGKLVVKM